MTQTYRPLSIPFYPRDFLCDPQVQAMTVEEVGAYVLLLFHAWMEEPPGTLPVDDLKLRKMARIGRKRTWMNHRDKILAPFILEKRPLDDHSATTRRPLDDQSTTTGKANAGYRLVQPRLVEEYAKALVRVRKAHKAAHKRWSDGRREHVLESAPGSANITEHNVVEEKTTPPVGPAQNAKPGVVDSLVADFDDADRCAGTILGFWPKTRHTKPRLDKQAITTTYFLEHPKHGDGTAQFLIDRARAYVDANATEEYRCEARTFFLDGMYEVEPDPASTGDAWDTTL